MQALLDIGATRSQSLPDSAQSLLAGQLLTPLTMYTRWSETYAIDNGAFSGFRYEQFQSLLHRERDAREQCLFVVVPDVPGSARRTLEVWQHRFTLVPGGWRLAYACQDGSENSQVPWDECAAVFIGGTTDWKLSAHVIAIIKAAKILRKHIHIGRVNTRERWSYFEKLGADTCDGSGLAQYDWMLEKIAAGPPDMPLFDGEIARASIALESDGGTVASRDKSSTGVPE